MLASGGDEHPLYVKPFYVGVGSENIYLETRQQELLVVIKVLSTTALENPFDPNNVFGNEKSVMKPGAIIIDAEEQSTASTTKLI